MPHLSDSKEIHLAIETSGRVGSIAFGDRDRLLTQTDLSGFRRHSSELIPIINDLLSRFSRVPNDIKRIYIPKGPGSFTGIRIAVAFAKMAAFALKAQITAMDTLDALAENATQAVYNKTVEITRLATVLDAKRGLFYIAVFEWKQDHFQRKSDDLLITAADFLSRFCSTDTPTHILGEGLLFYQKLFEHPRTVILNKELWPARAEAVWRLGRKLANGGQIDDPYTLTPLYIRRPEAEEIWEKTKISSL